MATFAGQFGPEAVIATVNGQTVTVPNSTVTVYEADGATPSTLYVSRLMAATAANPTSTDSDGNLLFYTTPGQHQVVINGLGVTRTFTVEVPLDPADAGTGTGVAGVATLNGRDGAVTLSLDDVIAAGLTTGSVVWAGTQDFTGAVTPALARTDSNAWTGLQDFTGATVSGLTSVTPVVSAVGNFGATFTYDMQSLTVPHLLIGTLTANCTLTLTHFVPGTPLRIVAIQDATGSRTLTVTDGVSSISPTLTATAAAKTVVGVDYDGVNLYVYTASASTSGTGGGGGGGGSGVGTLFPSNSLFPSNTLFPG